MSKIITRKGLEKITEELNHMLQVERPSACQFVEDTRPIGVVEDNPEYLQAIENQDRVERRIAELREILSDCVLFNPQMIKPNKVSFGATVEIINEDTNDIKKYTIVSIYESDVSKGYISVECPLVKSMLGCTIGEEFYFGDYCYIVNNITYSL